MQKNDFTNLPRRKKSYNGANGSKICVELNGDLYMIKFPAGATLNANISYTNGCISEYLGCHIFNELGMTAQDTLLGTFTTEKEETVPRF